MPHGTGNRAGRHNAIREGLRLGVVLATSLWIWIATIDLMAGEPFRTFTVLGGMASFTAMLYALNLAYGTVIVACIHGFVREPGLIGGLVLGFLILEFAFALVTIVFTHAGLGALAWLRIFGGSVLAAAVALAVLMRRHPLLTALRQARVEEAGV
jgi:hypothetical protein